MDSTPQRYFLHLKQPAKFYDQPLHGAEVEEHRDEEVEEVDDREHLQWMVLPIYP